MIEGAWLLVMLAVSYPLGGIILMFIMDEIEDRKQLNAALHDADVTYLTYRPEHGSLSLMNPQGLTLVHEEWGWFEHYWTGELVFRPVSSDITESSEQSPEGLLPPGGW